MLVIRLLITIVLAFITGKLVAKLKLPSILGWLIEGMILGPHAFSIMNNEILNATWYQAFVHILECAVGLMIGTELVWNKIKKSGKAIVITTLTQSLGTFFLVSIVFGIVFYFMDIPLYLAVLFGGIALATAPAPALSIVREFNTNGPVTNTLIPMAALDDIVGCIVFFTTIALVAGNLSAGNLPAYMITLVILLPLVIGVFTGLIAGFILKKDRESNITIILLLLLIIFTSGVGFYFNEVIMPKPVLNFMLMGMAFSATFSNMISEERLENIMHSFNPILGVAMIIVILNLGAPLNYHLILGAGIFTVIYIITRAAGKYLGAYFGASITKSPETVKKYLGLTLLPHSGVSLVFTGIAVNVLTKPAPECAQIIQGTIAAAAVINEVIAVIMAKKGFEWANELQSDSVTNAIEKPAHTIITISREHGSGGREVAKRLSDELGIPFYDNEIIEIAAKNSPIMKSFFENSETNGEDLWLHELSSGAHTGISINDKVYFYQSKIIKEIAEQGPCIIVGRCADYVLKEYPRVLKVFIYADLESRKHRIAYNYKEADESALKNIEKIDKKRATHYNIHTGQVFGKAANYDICLSSSVLGIDECVNIVKEVYLKNNN